MKKIEQAGPGEIVPEKIVFPSDYQVRVIARASDDLRERIDAIFTRHFGPFDESRVSLRNSAQQNFISLNYLMLVTHVEQLSHLHEDLKASEGVVMVL